GAVDEADVVIIGTGIGGATLGYDLAKAGRSVIFIEQGRDLSSAGAITGAPLEATREFQAAPDAGKPELLARAGRSAEYVRDSLRGDTFLPYIGCGTGGSSSLYGMVLERLFPRDLEGWPISYEDLAPWYTAAEALYQVSGGA